MSYVANHLMFDTEERPDGVAPARLMRDGSHRCNECDTVWEPRTDWLYADTREHLARQHAIFIGAPRERA